ncbi:hypothetical protein COCVIDRAFT_97999 [Bipolaris victoriae FI3]|uniref:Cytochrome P450 n=1 Tax=Bipolaris victoriae (strain FI3) TaxID=930091 RepID=W7EU21_BIPV3|nr:hypothetical protein COCVIDRAFT_97999 [Bipolaris victoriae FI3]
MLLEFLFNIRIWIVLIIPIIAFLFRSRRRSIFPTINNFPFDPLSQKAHQEYRTNAESLITNGLAKHQGPISLSVPSGKKIVLPASLTAWAKSNKNLDHRELVRQDFYAGFPGFEAQDALHASGDVLLDVIRTKLGQNESIMSVVTNSIAKALQIHWGDDKDWHVIDWQKDTTGIIARAASSIFVGSEKCEDEEWLGIAQGYVGAYFTAVNELHEYPAWSRRIVQRFLPNAVACRKYVAQARAIVKELIANREKKVEEAKRKGDPLPQYNDALAWVQAVPGPKADAGDIQLSLAMAAFFTTSEQFRQVLIDVASHPELIEPLRKEVCEQISTHGITIAATNNMVLLDSVLKESQRLSSPIVALERVALKDTTLPTGENLPRGSHIMVDCTGLRSPAKYPSPDHFDGYRFLRQREAGDKFTQFVQSGPDYNVFGGGRHICPGRYFASNELKLTMAHILLKYEIRMVKGYQSSMVQMGVHKMADPVAKFEVRRRDVTEMDLVQLTVSLV